MTTPDHGELVQQRRNNKNKTQRRVLASRARDRRRRPLYNILRGIISVPHKAILSCTIAHQHASPHHMIQQPKKRYNYPDKSTTIGDGTSTGICTVYHSHNLVAGTTATTATTTTTKAASLTFLSGSLKSSTVSGVTSYRLLVMCCLLGAFAVVSSLLLANTLLVFGEAAGEDAKAADAGGAAKKRVVSPSELSELLEEIRGDDVRMVRWDASSHTRKIRKKSSDRHCGEAMAAALDLLLESSGSTPVRTMADACEYATFCITDSPTQRQVFAGHAGGQGQGLYERVVELAKFEGGGEGNEKDDGGEDRARLSAMACHLVYIASFANAANQKGFHDAGAVDALGGIIKKSGGMGASSEGGGGDAAKDGGERKSSGGVSRPRADQVMWAAAALQNLAASYCEGTLPRDGRCYWRWHSGSSSVNIVDEVLPVFADGAPIREAILRDEELVSRLIELSCEGPVRGDESDDNPYPGVNAAVGRHDDHPNIVPWAATGLLKNLALEGEALPLLEPSVRCYCQMFHSADWLEENKGQGLIRHLRWDDPCWHDPETDLLCVDYPFLDREGYHCGEYGGASRSECREKDRHGTRASEACCGCGGGMRDPEEEGVEEEL